ncbi:hypothetical protein JNW88_25740 [Micromonospora sp. ATA32]|nr:hypothetical protein [Micromonospora sp. ATA32]
MLEPTPGPSRRGGRRRARTTWRVTRTGASLAALTVLAILFLDLFVVTVSLVMLGAVVTTLAVQLCRWVLPEFADPLGYGGVATAARAGDPASGPGGAGGRGGLTAAVATARRTRAGVAR